MGIEAFFLIFLMIGLVALSMVAFSGAYKMSDENFYLGGGLISLVFAYAFYQSISDSEYITFHFYFFIPFALACISSMAVIKLQDKRLFYPFLVLLVATILFFSKTKINTPIIIITLICVCVEIYFLDKLDKPSRDKDSYDEF